MVDGSRHVGEQVRVAVAVARHERADLDPRGRLRPRAEHRPALEVLTVRITIQGIEVIPVEDDVGAELLRFSGGAADLLVGGVLRLQLQAHTDGPAYGSCHGSPA